MGKNDKIDIAVMTRARQIFEEYRHANSDRIEEALMAASVKLAKLEFAENARLKKEQEKTTEW